jgi:hypothetical protein
MWSCRSLPMVAPLAVALLAACGPDDDPISHVAALANHPHAHVADRLARRPVSYPWRFVIMADAHTPPGEVVFSRLRAQIRNLDPPPSFVINVGDFVITGAMQEHQAYLETIDPFPIPVFSVIGNHEMGVPEGRKNYRALFGDESFSFDFAGCRFMALSDIVPRHNGLSDGQIAWLEEQLADPTVRDRLVFMHAPPPYIPPPWGAPDFQNADAFAQLVEGYGVRLVGMGHIHEYRHRLINGVHYFVTGGGGGGQDPLLQDPTSQGIFHHFLLVTVEADGKSKVEVIREGDWPVVDPAFTVWFETTPVN